MIYKHFGRPDPKEKKKSTRAAVIRYDKDNDKAPVVVAQGRGEVARKIIEKAKEHNIAMQEDALLLDNLLSLDLGSSVPPQMYQVVAEMMLFVRRANEGAPPSPIRTPALHQTSYWEDEEQDEEVSIDDLLSAIKKM
ncbi:EscU/YscU/HrcU family type III secretion system export apparatus switch protein [Aneurinibacillus uraniidurans]|uniref:EscU/YscU/HrcU family type III secretion system export apparatus switch protein n=1 Tax=Aneurinibacillus uraniidurans TaxID=2966586 RepID=UPI00300E0E76